MVDDVVSSAFPAIFRIVAMHNSPGLRAWAPVAVRPGPMMAAADPRQHHGQGQGRPTGRARIISRSIRWWSRRSIITAAQSIVSRNVSPMDSAVVSLCSIEAGNPGAMSVIPREAKIVGTVRTFRRDTQDLVEENLRRLCESIAAGFGRARHVRYERVYPATINWHDEAVFAQRVAEELVGPDRLVHDLEPSMGSEDFALHVFRGAPGRVFPHRTGRRRHQLPAQCPLPDDGILPLGAALFVRLVESAMPLAD